MKSETLNRTTAEAINIYLYIFCLLNMIILIYKHLALFVFW